MRRILLWTLVGASFTVPLWSAAAKKADVFDAFREELLQTTGADEADDKAFKQMNKCRGYDERWQSQLQDPQTYSLEEVRNWAQASMACWEKIETSYQTGNEPVDSWVARWQDYVVGVEMYVWARQARQEGDRDNTCYRLAEAVKLLQANAEAAEHLQASFQTTEGRDLGGAPLEATLAFRDEARKLLSSTGCE
jgi:hypothetical protein